MKFYPEKLIKHIEEQRISITKFAKKIGISRNTVYCWKNGSATPSDVLIRNIARYLNIKVSEISDLEEILNSDTLSDSIDIIDIFQKKDEVDYYIKQYEQLSIFLEKSKNEVLRVNIILKALFSSIKSHLYIKDANLNYVMGNETFKKSLNFVNFEIHGLSDYELYPRKIANIIKEKDLAVLEQSIDQIGLESTIPGTVIPCLESRYLIRDKNDNILGIAGVYENISNLKKRIRTNSIITELINIADDAIWLAKIKKINNKIRFKKFYDNRARYKLFNVMKAPYVLPENWTDYIHYDDKEKVLEAIEKQNKISNSSIELSYRMIFPGNKIKYVSEKRFTFVIEDECYAGGMQRDITEIIKTEDENRALRYGIDNSNMVIYTGRSRHGTSEFVFEYVNSATEDILGLTEEEFRDDMWREIIADDSKNEYAEFVKNIDKKDNRDYKFHIIHKIKNELRWVNLKTEIRRGQKEDYHIGYFHDITEKKKQEDVHKALLSVHDNSKDAVWIKTSEEVVYANKAAKNLYGADIVGSEMLPVINVDIPDYGIELDGKKCDLMDVLSNCENKETDQTMNFIHKHEIIKENKQIIYCESSYQFQRKNDYVQIFCSTKDVTKTKYQNDKDNFMFQCLKETTDRLNICFWIHKNNPFEYIYTNKTFYNYYGDIAKENNKYSWQSFIHDDDLVRVTEFYKKHDNDNSICQYRFISHDKRELLVNEKITRYKENNIEYCIGSIEEVYSEGADKKIK
ncbi:MAG: PAS domain S-box protein [bacterium]|nr:PAS domain S-box protein [bacterium]